MHNKTLITLLIGAVTTGFAGISLAQTQTPAPGTSRRAAAVRDHEGRGHRQRLYLPLSEPPGDVRRHARGVIATDPISYGRPQAAKAYLEEIRKITKAPIKYLIYSHHHYDHIAGGKPFKDAGATVIAHRAPRSGSRR